MRVGVTGADGFTGRHLERALAERGASLVPLSADLRDPTAVRAELAATAIDRLVHLAGIAFVATDDWRPFYEVNQLGTFTLLEAAAAARPGMRCILASSAQVYGSQSGGLLDEAAPVRPANHYATSKFAMELGSRHWADRLDIIVVRPFNYTGTGQETRYLIPKIVDHFRRRAPRIALGNLDVRRDFGDVRAVAAAYAGLALAEGSLPRVLNLCSGAVHGLREVVAMAEALTGHTIEIDVNPAFVRANDVPLLGGDPAQLLAALPGWAPIPLTDTLAWMLTDAAD